MQNENSETSLLIQNGFCHLHSLEQSAIHQCLHLTQGWEAEGRDDPTTALTSALELEYLTGG